MEKEAKFYKKRDDGKVECHLCPNNCIIAQDKTGVCGVRKNKGGTLYTLIYGEVSSIAMDPIEKKPLYHFYPGSTILSIGTVGCSFKCQFCQNYTISQNPDCPTDTYRSDELVKYAKNRNSVGIAYTYSEPLIWYEFVYDTCVKAQNAGLKNVFVTNGYINREPLLELLPVADAFNIDLKSFSEDFYRKHLGGKLKPVLETIEEISKHKEIVLEVTTLIIPGYNDSSEEIAGLTDFLASLRKDIPYHLSAYYPMYKFTAPPTPLSTLERLRDVAAKKMKYVYLGNVRGDSNTYCHNCGSALVERFGYSIRIVNYKDGKCQNCETVVPIVG
jgi:pyruvate formate lyase activating enzyme